MICFFMIQIYLCVMCYDVLCLFGNLSCFWSCVNRSTFLANLLYSCAKLPLYPHVSIRVDPELVPNEF